MVKLKKKKSLIRLLNEITSNNCTIKIVIAGWRDAYNSMLLYSMFSVNVHLVDSKRAISTLSDEPFSLFYLLDDSPWLLQGGNRKSDTLKVFTVLTTHLMCTIVSIRQYPILFAKCTIYN